jgi:hypothetical protein
VEAGDAAELVLVVGLCAIVLTKVAVDVTLVVVTTEARRQ